MNLFVASLNNPLTAVLEEDKAVDLRDTESLICLWSRKVNLRQNFHPAFLKVLPKIKRNLLSKQMSQRELM